MYEPSILSLLPPVLAIVLAISTRQVLLSLGGGIWLGYCLLLEVNPLSGLAASIEGVVAVFGDAGNTRVIIFTLLVGGLLATMESSGGVRGYRLAGISELGEQPAARAIYGLGHRYCHLC